MVRYTVTVSTRNERFDGTNAYVYVTLVGTEGFSEKTLLDKPFTDDFERGAMDVFELNVGKDLGEILLVKIEKKKYWIKDEWYCRYIAVKTPSGDYIEFPCYRWPQDDKEVVLRDGRARLPQDDKTGLVKQQRQKELKMRRETYRWKEWQPGFPKSIDADKYSDLPRDIQFDSDKKVDFTLNFTEAIENLSLNKLMGMFQSSWSSLEDFKEIFIRIKTPHSEYVMKHWEEDLLFGYQFLNGCNPIMIQKCTKLPDKFPVTHGMVSASLERGITLEQEIEAGNIFIVDYEVLDGVAANNTDPNTPQYLAAPICLLYNNTQNKILPIAIQLGQTPGRDMPIFFPTDSQHDWLLAKMWVRSSDFQYHQTITHLLRTHLMSEMFAIAMFRQLPAVHPVYKLLIPHVHFTIAINSKAREQLICKGGLFDKANSSGGGGQVVLVQKTMESLTFRSLCFPDMIKSRGVDKKDELPTFFYRDDGYMVWEAIKSYVSDVVHIYYSSDETVQEDEEIQAFVNDVSSSGMKGFDHCEFPKSLKTREELTEYLAVIVFTASAQHAAVNFGQFDWDSWITNAPSTMRRPPPNQKGVVDMNFIMESLPDRGRCSWHIGAVWALSQYQKNELYLGMFPEEHFTEVPVKKAMEKFRKQLEEITSSIKKRNEGKRLQYYNMSPDKIPNSVAV
ncbi:polyunsaturated fatty acid 5-lipoxygenase [Xyrichtys novacula]|uniref:Polyunsaturated fatty acid 5-lipoxygenase n=1 Tax=Xyrichtys novacula TaxID=13765 RepID=A0AAV1G252_XYRNO|nr:polyunsaturated fatty acid 5-lipoxygenase [Xyrichtys novacula]